MNQWVSGDPDSLRILHVDDDRDFADVAAEFLELEDERFDVTITSGADEGLDLLAETSFDCVISDYEMPERNGIEFLEAVRKEAPELPFILYTGKGSEEVASEAISAGVTDYLQKGAGREQYELLATRVRSAVERYRTRRELERQNDLFARAQAIANVGAWEYHIPSGTSYVTDQLLRIHGLSPDEELSPERSLEHYHPAYRGRIREAFDRAVDTGEGYDLEARFVTADGTDCWVRTRGEPQYEDGEVVRVRGTLQEITDRRRREEKLERQNRRLERFAHVLSHDITGPLHEARANLDVAREEGSDEAFRTVREAHDRIETLIEEVLALTEQGPEISSTEIVDVHAVARDAWASVATARSTLRVTGECEITADRGRLQQVFENLFRNAIGHSIGEVTVTVGPIEPPGSATRDRQAHSRGFYVADDGPGIPEDERESVFEAGLSTTAEGTGLGLSVVEQIADAHGWTVELTESVEGGARFEFTEVEFGQT